MSSLLMYAPLAPASNAVSRGGLAANLLTPDPKEVWIDTASDATAQTLDFDMGATVSFDSVFIGFTNAVAGTMLEITSGVGSYTSGVRSANAALLAASDVAAPRRKHGFRNFAPVASRYIRLTVNHPAGNPFLQIGIVAIGLSIQPAFGREWGSGRQPVDMSKVEDLKGGGFGIDRGARAALVKFTCGDLSDAETAALWDMASDVGISAPVLFCEDPAATAGLNERLHYGLFRQPESYERQLPNLNRWAFNVREWV